METKHTPGNWRVSSIDTSNQRANIYSDDTITSCFMNLQGHAGNDI